MTAEFVLKAVKSQEGKTSIVNDYSASVPSLELISSQVIVETPTASFESGEKLKKKFPTVSSLSSRAE